MPGKDGGYESGCPSRVTINTREIWKVEHGNARELLNVGSLSSLGSGEDSCARALESKGSQPDDTRVATCWNLDTERLSGLLGKRLIY